MIDNAEVNRILEKLENHDDEAEAVSLLKEFNAASSRLGKLLLNLDKTLDHETWKSECDRARAELEAVMEKIEQL